MAGKWFYRRAWADQVETGSYCTKCGKYLGKSTATLCAACYMVLVYETRAENRDILASIETEEKP